MEPVMSPGCWKHNPGDFGAIDTSDVDAYVAQFRETRCGGPSMPVPPGGKAKDARCLNVHEDDLDEAQLAKRVKQTAGRPGWVTSDIHA
jgi:hypothetical protein